MISEKAKQSLEDEAALFFGVFGSPDGMRVLKKIRELSHIDTATRFADDARREAYDLGRASLFVDIERIINRNKKENA